MPSILSPQPDSHADPHARAQMALAILQQREHTENNLELAVLALRGADIFALVAADAQMSG